MAMNEKCRKMVNGMQCQGEKIPDEMGAKLKCNMCGNEEVAEWVQHIERKSLAHKIKEGGSSS
jgi:hypothetical protein